MVKRTDRLSPFPSQKSLVRDILEEIPTKIDRQLEISVVDLYGTQSVV